MAPEFFPFILLFALVAALAVVLAMFAYYFFAGRSSKPQRRSVPRALSVILVLVTAAVLFVGRGVRQQFFLNEPMVSAVAEGKVEEARRLLDRGASPDAYGIDFVETALIAATRSGSVESITLLLSRGADPELQDIYGNSALQHARKAGDPKIIRLIEDALERRKKGPNKSPDP
jgi:ankyrin repeat protein